jgi:hypothetical protein
MSATQYGSQSSQLNYNFLSAADLVAKSVGPNQIPIYGSQLMVMLSETMGGKREVENIKTSHFEDVKIMPLINVTNGGAGAAGATVPCTLNTTSPNNQLLNLSQSSPYVAGTPNPYAAGSPVKNGDKILIPPTVGPHNPSTYIYAIVTNVVNTSTTATTFNATPLSSADSIPALTTVDVMIADNAYGEGSNQPTSFSQVPTEKFFNLQIFKHTYRFTGTAKSLRTWLKDIPFYTIRGEEDQYKVFLNKLEMGCIIGMDYDNPLVQSNAQTPISMTKGLIPSIIQDGGYVQGYSVINGYGINEYEELVLTLDKETMSGQKDYMQELGLSLSLGVDRSMLDTYKNGAIQYNAFGGAAVQAATLNYDQIGRGNYNFYKKTYDPFNNSQNFGATGFNFVNEGMVIPMKGGNDAKNKGEYIPAMATLYLKDREREVTEFNGFKQDGSGGDFFEVRYLGHRGMEFYGLNRFAYIQEQ